MRESDWRLGGRCPIVMLDPNGEETPSEGVVFAFEPGRRFVFTDALTAGWHLAGPFMVGVFEIEPDGTDTRYGAQARHRTREVAERYREMGFDAGWGAPADQSKALAESRTWTGAAPSGMRPTPASAPVARRVDDASVRNSPSRPPRRTRLSRTGRRAARRRASHPTCPPSRRRAKG